VSVIPATQGAEIKRILIQSQPGQTVCKTIFKKTGGVAQGIGLEFKPQYHEKQTKNPHSTSLVTRRIQIKTTRRYHLCTWMARIKKSDKWMEGKDTGE
jgi:hypothetical protein